jgi:hypothetical protein
MAALDDFKARLRGGGSRNSLFNIKVNFPAIVGGNNELASFMIKAATMPASTIAPIEVPFRGQKLKIAGNRTFENWSITVINDTDMNLRNSFERWLSLIANHTSQGSAFTGGNSLGYMTNMVAEHLDRNNNVTKQYDFVGAYPVSVSSIDLASGGGDDIEEFTVDIAYQYWTSPQGSIV